jgi:GNAT superfamily N-acetyltransferase
METRLFVEDDRTELRRVYLDARKHTFDWLDTSIFTIDDFDLHTKGETIWVAEYGSKPAAFISVCEAENFIHNLFVHPKAAGQGLGSSLLEKCLSSIGRPAVLKCLTLNTPAIDFYLSKNWRTVSEADGPDGKYLLMHFDGDCWIVCGTRTKAIAMCDSRGAMAGNEESRKKSVGSPSVSAGYGVQTEPSLTVGLQTLANKT